MLKEYEIKNIISIDDGWSVSKEIKDEMEKQKVPENTTIGEYCAQYSFDIVPEEIDYYEEIKYEFLKDIKLFELKIPNTYAEITQNLNLFDSALMNLKTILSKISAQEKISIYYDAEFNNKYQVLQGNTLYILDKNMGDGEEDAAIGYIIDIIEKRKDYRENPKD